MKGFTFGKPVMKLAVAGSTRRGRGSTKEKGHTPMVMGSRPMAKERAENGTAPMGGSLTPIIFGTIHGLSLKSAVAGKTAVWTSAALWEEKCVMHNENILHTA